MDPDPKHFYRTSSSREMDDFGTRPHQHGARLLFTFDLDDGLFVSRLMGIDIEQLNIKGSRLCCDLGQ